MLTAEAELVRLKEHAKTMAEHKPTTDPRQLWMFFGLLLLVVAFFGYAVLPHVDPGRSRLSGKPAPDFTLEVLSEQTPGNRLALSDLRGQVVVLDFWASWCGPCRQQAPIIESVYRKFEAKGLRVVGINTSDQPKPALQFLATAGLTYPSVVDTTGLVSRAFGADQLPTLVLIDREGVVRSVQPRVVPEKELTALVENALGEGG
jgi:peroxiredoxin